MNVDVKKVWLEALRSGKYTQVTSQLRKDDGFCCLGVLCDLAPASVGKWHEINAAGSINFGEGKNVSNSVLPEGVMVWSGVESNGRVDSDAKSLSVLNDLGKTFNEIADIIEEQL